MSKHAETDATYTPNLQEFSYAISHDLGAAIRGISQLTGMLEQDVSEKINDKERYWMQLIKSSADNAQSMIDAMTVYTRLESSYEKARELNLEHLVETILAKCISGCTTEMPLVIPKVSLNLQMIKVSAIKSHWVLLLSELINNALQSYQENVALEIKLSLQVLANQNRAKLVVEDNGAGVCESKLSGLTKPFSSSRKKEGSQHLGMGLSYCARIAQLNQASLHFGESGLGGFKVEYEFSI